MKQEGNIALDQEILSAIPKDYSGLVAHIKKAVINVVIDRLLAAHQLILICDINLMDRMTLFYKRRNDSVQPDDILAYRTGTSPAGAVLSTENRRLNLTGHAVLTSVKRAAGFT